VNFPAFCKDPLRLRLLGWAVLNCRFRIRHDSGACIATLQNKGASLVSSKDIIGSRGLRVNGLFRPCRFAFFRFLESVDAYADEADPTADRRMLWTDVAAQ
jgi:hypothetical protein